MRYIAIFLGTFVCVFGLGLGAMWLNRIEVHDPAVCKNNETLAKEVNRRMEAGEMRSYQMLYCPVMQESRWDIVYVPAEDK
jgi:hypothetical protein